MFVIFVTPAQKQTHRPQHTKMQTQAHNPQSKNINYSCIISIYPDLNLSGSPFFQKTSVKKNQNRFHQSKPDHNPDLDPYKPYT